MFLLLCNYFYMVNMVKKNVLRTKFYELFMNTEMHSSHCFAHVVDTN